MTRRTFVASMSAVAVVPPASLATEVARPRLAGAPPRPDADYLFFDAAEAAFIEPACQRLLAPDLGAPGALGIRVARYLDWQLASPWGAGQRLYRPGPWQPGTAVMGVASSSPATVFRRALHAINRRFQHDGTSFRELDVAGQLAFLRLLAGAGSAGVLDGVPSALFFDLLLGMSVEGFFTGSPLAPHCGVITWPLKGFPGAYFRETGLRTSAL